MVKKRFYEWIKVKKSLHESSIQKCVKEGEVWWCGMGENVGVEINGKNEEFSRPILVFKKFGKYEFMGIPLSTKYHKGSWYVTYNFQGKKRTAVLCQAKTISVKRLYKRIGQLDEKDMLAIGNGFYKLLFEKNLPQLYSN
ncbi:type II toxin-antitoxin system PemK/MazF family toxin [Candidatus Saccharibacteria bacterium]|nr:type II toxin-antitoxin system PemK/MazF family toxin [Candidatus Saccharibacteria bacterium]